MSELLRGLWRFSADLTQSSSAQRLDQALSWLVRHDKLPFMPTQKTLTAQGKPFFADLPKLHFSISHCAQEWICLFAGASVGIDIEQPRRCAQEAITRRFFHPREQAWLNAHPDDFFLLWTAKESVVKWSGLGIGEGFAQFSVIDDHGQLLQTDAYRLISFTTKKGTPGTMCLSASLDCVIDDQTLV